MPPVKNVSVDVYAQSLLTKWEAGKRAQTGKLASGGLSAATSFILDALDEAIQAAETFVNITSGEDKKKFVMAVITRIYDTVVGAALPYYLWPFAAPLKSIILNIIVSNVIDWIVAKYKDGSWAKPQTPEPIKVTSTYVSTEGKVTTERTVPSYAVQSKRDWDKEHPQDSTSDEVDRMRTRDAFKL